MKKYILILLLFAVQLELYSGVLQDYRRNKRDVRTIQEIGEKVGVSKSGGTAIITIGICVLLPLVLFIYIFGKIKSRKNKLKQKEEIDNYFLTIKKEFEKEDINLLGLKDLKEEAEVYYKRGGYSNFSGVKKNIDYTLSESKREKLLLVKYGEDKGGKIFKKEFFLGMTKEELIDSSGVADKIETNVLKTKTTETWIYGNKSSGDVFVFENELLVRFKDR